LYPGIDIIEIARFAGAIERQPALVARLFTDEEQEELKGRPVQSWAGRFAAKEAVFKALGQGIGTLSFHDIVIRNDQSGEPQVFLSKRALEFAVSRGCMAVRISISHNRTQAIAMAVLT
jgi:holo-[acyl-carrier protein] synthase